MPARTTASLSSTPLRIQSNSSEAFGSHTGTSGDGAISPAPPSLAPSEIFYKPHQNRPPFRTPSSVRALQLSSPSPLLAPAGRKWSAAGQSDASGRSENGKFGTDSNDRFACQSPMPLVLLHVSVLPAQLPRYSRAVMEATAPPHILENYHLMMDKLCDAILTRGVLIPHPGEEYDLLEERLLEALELCVPRVLGCGHFVGDCREFIEDAAHMICDFAHNGEQDANICETCDANIRVPGRGVGHGLRRWDVKFYASNGLMRAGAWSAAWREMERVDVEISPWMPLELRRALDEAQEKEDLSVERSKRQEEVEMLQLDLHTERQKVHQYHQSLLDLKVEKDKLVDALARPAPSDIHSEERLDDWHQLGRDIPLSQLLMNYVYVLGQDKRNIMIALLSLLLLLSLSWKSGNITRQMESYSSPTMLSKDSAVISNATVLVDTPALKDSDRQSVGLGDKWEMSSSVFSLYQPTCRLSKG